jgi:hypothetical protein
MPIDETLGGLRECVVGIVGSIEHFVATSSETSCDHPSTALKATTLSALLY